MRQLKTKKRYANSLWAVILPLAIFFALGIFFAIERAGVIFNNSSEPTITYLPEEYIIPRANRKLDVRCLVIDNSTEEYNTEAVENIKFVLDRMSIGHTVVNIGKPYDLPPLQNYKTIIIGCQDLENLYTYMFDIFDWVRAGGGLLFALTPDEEVLSTIFYRDMGIEWGVYQYVPQITATLDTDLLAGGIGTKMQWSAAGNKNDHRSGVNFLLSESCTVHMTSDGPQGPTPMLWEHRAGSGRIVVNNNDAMAERWSRGLIAVTYSLVEPAVAWPVINASMFFIDDFPAPIAGGYTDYIKRDYGVQNDYFFTHIWFPDMLRIADKYKIKYSSVFIETYTDNVEPPFETLENTERMKYFGSLFLNEGHEIGLHGFNHQSLVLENFDYQDKLPYNKWPSPENMVAALSNTVKLQQELFPGHVMKTYVPPSNVLSKEGRAVLKNNFPEITAISGLLNDGLFGLHEDFGIGEDGLINIPRIASEYYPLDHDLDETAFWTILCELNWNFINSHFIHPDDVMDPERGAERGWRRLTECFEDFLTWLGKFPIRQLTSQEAAAAVQRFYNLNVHTRLSRSEIALNLEGLYDEAYLFVRINSGSPRDTQGGTLTKVSGNLYLLKAESPDIVIYLE